MHKAIEIKEPLLEVGFKAYLYGDKAVELAKAADKVSAKYGMPIIITAQCADIYRISQATDNILVFAQHGDSLEIGRGAGSILLEALKAAGAAGVMLNHAEKRLTLSEINKTIKRANKVGLATLVCADSPEEALAVAHLGPNIVSPEPPELINTNSSVGNEQESFVTDSVNNVKSINPDIVVMLGAGIRSGADITQIVKLGAGSAGSSSGVLNAPDPAAMIDEMARALKEAWQQRRS